MTTATRRLRTAVGLAATLALAAGFAGLSGALAEPQVLAGAALALALGALATLGWFSAGARRGGTDQDELRRQALALAQCMKDLTRRTAALEARLASEPAQAPAPAALTVTTEMAMPGPPPPVARLEDFASSLSRPRALSRPEAPARVNRIVNLPHRRATGYLVAETMAGTEAEIHVETVLDLAFRRLRAESSGAGVVIASIGVPLTEAPRALRQLEERLAAEPGLRSRLLLGLSQASITAGGEERARAIGRLSASGLGLCLTEVTRLALDPAALKACGFRQVRVSAEALLAGLEQGDPAVERLGPALAGLGLGLAADGVGSERMIPELIDLGVGEISGPAVDLAARPGEPPRVLKAG